MSQEWYAYMGVILSGVDTAGPHWRVNGSVDEWFVHMNIARSHKVCDRRHSYIWGYNTTIWRDRRLTHSRVHNTSEEATCQFRESAINRSDILTSKSSPTIWWLLNHLIKLKSLLTWYPALLILCCLPRKHDVHQQSQWWWEEQWTEWPSARSCRVLYCNS